MKSLFAICIAATFTFNNLYAQKPQLVIDRGHTADIIQLKWIDGGKKLLSTAGYPEKNVKLWDVQTGKLIHNFVANFEGLNFEVSKAEKELVVMASSQINNRSEVQIWDLASKKMKFSRVHENTSFFENYFFQLPYYFLEDTLFDMSNQKNTRKVEGVNKKCNREGKLIAIRSSNLNNELKILDLNTLKEIYALKLPNEIYAFDFSQDGQWLLCLENSYRVSIWDFKQNKQVWSKDFKLEREYLNDVVLSDDKKRIMIREKYGSKAIVCHIETAQSWTLENVINYSPDLKQLICLEKITEKQNKLIIRNIESQKNDFSLTSQNSKFTYCIFNPDKTQLFIGSADGTLALCNLNGKVIQNFGIKIQAINKVMAMDEDNILIATENSISHWNKKEGKSEKLIYKSQLGYKIGKVALSKSLDAILLQEYNTNRYSNTTIDTTQFANQTLVIHLQTGKELWKYPTKENAFFTLSGDEKSMFLAEKGVVHEIDLQSFQKRRSFKMQIEEANDNEGYGIEFIYGANTTKDNRFMIFEGNTVGAPMISVMDLQTEQFKFNFTDQPALVYVSALQNKKNILLAGGTPNYIGADNYAPLFALDVDNGKHLRDFLGHRSPVLDVAFHPLNENLFASASADNSIKIWNIEQDNALAELKGHQEMVNSLAFEANGKYLVSGSQDGSFIFWDLKTYQSILEVFLLDATGNYLIISPDGRFDGTPEAIDKLIHFAANDEIIELEQLKDRYYEPHLWKKMMAMTDEPLRQIPALESIALYPDVKIKMSVLNPKSPLLSIQLKNQGGGIGRVSVFINGKEALYDARISALNIPSNLSEAVREVWILEELKKIAQKTDMTLQIDLTQHYLIQPNLENMIEVRAYNGENWLVSRPMQTKFVAPKDWKAVRLLESRGNQANEENNNLNDSDPNASPELYAVVIGVSKYANAQINLKFSSKDAEDFARALELGAKRLFEQEEKNKVHIKLLNSNQSNLIQKPSRINILKAFEEISQKVRHQDVIIVYLAGHGVNYGGQDGDFYFLTQEALSLNLQDPAIRKEGTISSTELTGFIKKMRAKKQILVMDACNSGRAVDNLIAKRDLETSTIRALDRMKDRTGLHIISGCTAGQSSYEASQFGQGILTYCLLSGIKGAALRENQYIDINELFQYAREKVPQLAKNLGGIQEPKIFSPYGAESFDIGVLTSEDKEKIPLAKAKPMLIQSNFQAESEFLDYLNLTPKVNAQLMDLSFRGNAAPWVFLDVVHYPDAFRAVGRYTVNGNMINAKVLVFKGNDKKALGEVKVEGYLNVLDDFAMDIAGELQNLLRKLER